MKLFYNSEKNKMMDAMLLNTSNKEIFIASAFFSNSEIIKYFINNDCYIQLVIRLNKGTSAEELEKLIPFIESHKIEIRFFTDKHFHPKFYIFGNKTAFIGSSNLTNNGVEVNQEMNIQIDDSTTINELKTVFESYWEQAKVLTKKDINNFKQISNEYNKEIENNISKNIKDVIGDITYKTERHTYDDDEIMFYCTGEGPRRNFDDYLKYSFISAGQVRRDTHFLYSKELRRLRKGMYFFAYQKLDKKNKTIKCGYVGFGKVIEDPIPIDKFLIDGKKLYELPLIQPGIKQNHENEACEWIAKVEWIKTVSRENPYFFPDIFTGARHTVCKMDKTKQKETLDFLMKKFDL